MPNFFPSARENIAVPDGLKRQIVFKWPDLNIRRYSYAIVAPDEVAVFMYQGQVRGILPPGRHRLDATEIPFLGLFADHVTGGNLYRTELYFVGSREYPSIAFGSQVDDVQDPVTGLVVSLDVEGEYSLRVVDPPTLLTNLTGTIDVTDNSAISDWVTQQLLKVLRANVTQRIVDNGWAILGTLCSCTRSGEGRRRSSDTTAGAIRYDDRPVRELQYQLGPAGRSPAQVPRPRHRILPPCRLLPAICGGQDAARCRDGHVKRWRKPKRRLSSSGPRRREPDQPATKHRAHPSSCAGICWRRFLPASATSAGI